MLDLGGWRLEGTRGGVEGEGEEGRGMGGMRADTILNPCSRALCGQA
jgi:hypothetical protein